MVQIEWVGLEDARWKRLLEEADADDYQLPGYARLLARVEGGAPIGLYGRGASGEFLVPLVLRTLPDLGEQGLRGWRDAISPYGFPGALVAGSFEDEAAELPGRVAEELRRNRILSCFIRMNPMRSSADGVLERLGTVVEGGETVFYDLTLDEELLWRSHRREHKHDIQELQREGYTSRVDHPPDFAPFKALYAETMRRVGASEYYRFDEQIFDELCALLGNRLHLVCALSPAGEVVSAATFLTGGERVLHAYLTGTCASRIKAGKLVYDTTWRTFKRLGYRALHMGGGLGRPNDSLLHFKKGLAKGRACFRTLRLVSDPELYRQAAAARGNAVLDLGGYFPAYRRPCPSNERREDPRAAESSPRTFSSTSDQRSSA